MAWLGALIGFVAALTFGWYAGIVLLTVLGACVGYVLKKTVFTKASPPDNTLNNVLARLDSYQQQIQTLRQRIDTLEHRLGDTAARPAANAAGDRVDVVSPPAASPATVASPVLPVTPAILPELINPLPAAQVDTDDAQAATDTLLPALEPEPELALESDIAPELGSESEGSIAKPWSELAQPQQTEQTAEAKSAPTDASAKAGSAGSATATPPAAETPSRPAPVQRPHVESPWVSTVKRWVFGGNPLVKIGAVILFLGLAFLLRYAAENSMLPVELRYAAVAAGGLGLIFAGWRSRNKADQYGLILQGAGIGVLYLTTLAAMKLHPLIPPMAGFALLFAVSMLAALLAVLQNAMALAVAASIAGFATPLLVSTGHPNHLGLFTYLSILNLGILAIAWFKAWRPLNLIGFAGTMLLAGGWAEQYYEPALFAESEPFLLLFFSIYLLITLLFARRRLEETTAEGIHDEPSPLDQALINSARKLNYVDAILAFGVPTVTFGMQYQMTHSMPFGAALSALGYAGVYLMLALTLFKRTQMRFALLNESLLALAVIFASLAIPLGLDAQWSTAGWAIEGAGIYWLGVRQSRRHARGFGLLLMFGACVYELSGLAPSTSEDFAAIQGSALGAAMIALGAWHTYWVMRKPGHTATPLTTFLQHATCATGALFSVLILPMLLPALWAGPAIAVLASVGMLIGVRTDDKALRGWSWAYQAVAGASFLGELTSTQGDSVLGHGWEGLLAALIVSAAMLAAVWMSIRHLTSRPSNAEQAEVGIDRRAPIAIIGILAACGFLNLAPLFVMNWRDATLVWPISALITLWIATRMRSTVLQVFATALHVLVIAVFWITQWTDPLATETYLALPVMRHIGFYGPLLFAIMALCSARLLYAANERPNGGQARAGGAEHLMAGASMAWGVAWWMYAWGKEINRVLPGYVTAALLAAVTVSTLLAYALSRKFKWRELLAATAVYLPTMLLIFLAQWSRQTSAPALLDAPEVFWQMDAAHIGHPFARWGWLAWPLALATHLFALRRAGDVLGKSLPKIMHAAGLWMFLVIFSMEVRWQFAYRTATETAWPLLGWMLVPTLLLWFMSRRDIERWWPFNEFKVTYRSTAMLPVILYLGMWIWVANLSSDGSAAPLPYLPIVNPLDLAELAVMLGIWKWWHSHQSDPQFSANIGALRVALAATAFGTMTATVIRTCHHWGNIAWDANSLLASNLVQTSISIVWALTAMGLMLTGNRRKLRYIWIIGASLMAVVVAKLFLVELAETGSLARIVSFIVIGLLLLGVGYVAPLPPRRVDSTTDSKGTQT